MDNLRVTFKWTDRDPFKVMENMKRAIYRRILLKAGRQAIRPIMLATKAAARSHKISGAWAKSIGTKVSIKKGKPVMFALAGARSKLEYSFMGKVKKPNHYQHLVEKHTPVLNPIAQQYAAQATATMFRVVAEEIDIEMNKG